MNLSTATVPYYRIRKGRAFFELGKSRAKSSGMLASYALGMVTEHTEKSARDLYNEWLGKRGNVAPDMPIACEARASEVDASKMTYTEYLKSLKKPFFIYIMKAQGIYKVGFTCDPRRRKRDVPREFKCGEVRVVSLYKLNSDVSPDEAEAACHTLLNQYNVRGEWFDCPLATIQKAIATGIASVRP